MDNLDVCPLLFSLVGVLAAATWALFLMGGAAAEEATAGKPPSDSEESQAPSPSRKAQRRRRRRLALVLVLALIGAAYFGDAVREQWRRSRSAAKMRNWNPEHRRAEGPLSNIPFVPVFEGDSKGLAATVVWAVPDAPLPPGQNVVWCASFAAAWKALEALTDGAPLALQDNPALVGALNAAADPRLFIPAPSLYTVSGWVDKGILAEINADFKERFPNRRPPTFPGIVPDSYLAYAYLEANLRFSYPYPQYDQPLMFTDGAGIETPVCAFGVFDDARDHAPTWQPAVLAAAWDDSVSPPALSEFIIDLDQASQPHQIVLAMIPPEPTLADALTAAQRKTAEADLSIDIITHTDVLLVPEVAFRIAHDFDELAGGIFTTPALAGKPIHVARQDILFRLDRSGAELRSDAALYFKLASLEYPARYVFDRPFLIYMKMRGEEAPFFAAWIDNSELLRPWDS